ncbi:MAG: LemA family protein [Clostridia bacterium]
MKHFKENRLIAWIVLVLCVLFSLSFSGGRALANLRAETEQVFYQGVHADGLSIGTDLDARAECAYNLASTASNYQDIDAALATSVRDASNALAAAKTIEEKYAANAACQRAVEDLYTALDNAQLSEKDYSFALRQYKEFQSRADTISRDDYNRQATQFNQTLSAFPASFVGGLSGVKKLSLFDK